MQDTFDLKDFIVTLLRKWRVLILCGLIFAVLGGTYQIVSDLNILNNPQRLTEQKRSDDIDMAIFEQKKKSLENVIMNMALDLERMEAYNKESLLMRINPFDKAVAAISFHIQTNDQITPSPDPALRYQQPDHMGQIAAAYMQLADTRELYDYILKAIDTEIELRYLKETLRVFTETGSGIITVEAVGDSAAYCEQVVRAAKQFFEQKQTLIDEVIFPHELTIFSESSYTMADLELDKLQTEYQDKVILLNSAMQESISELKALRQPSPTVPTKSSIITSGIQYTLLGGIAGVGLGMLSVFFLDAMNIRVKSGKELRQRFGIKILGSLPAGGKRHV